MTKASAPSKVILFGEHAVVYNKLGLSSAVDRRVHTHVSSGKGIKIKFPFKNEPFVFTKEQIIETYERFMRFQDQGNVEGLKKMGFIDGVKVVLGELSKRFGDLNLKINVEFEKNMTGLGTSAAVYSSLVLAVSKFTGDALSKDEVFAITNLGETASHGGRASGIDASTTINGGVLRFKKIDGGIRGVDFGLERPLVVVDSGVPGRTNEMVSKVAQLMQTDPARAGLLIDSIGDVSTQALDHMKNMKGAESGNMEKLGKLMNENHSLLKELGVSTEDLDKIVNMGLENGALGAKMTGGGGGGSVIVLGRNKDHAQEISDMFNKNGYDAFCANLGCEGLRAEE